MALIHTNYTGLPDLAREYDIDLRALARMAERHQLIKAIRIKDRLFIDMDAARKEADIKELSLAGFLNLCSRQSRH